MKLYHGSNMTDKQQEMIEYSTQDVIAFIMEDNQLKMEDAMDLFYTSSTFAKLSDVETGLYLQGSSYVYELFKQETVRSDRGMISPPSTPPGIPFGTKAVQ